MEKREMKSRKMLYKRLLIISLFFTLFLVVFFFTYQKLFIFPQLHQYQKSPREFVVKGETLGTILPMPIVVEHGLTNKKKVALTFDADMTYGMLNVLKKGEVKSWYNKPVIDYLIHENVKATVFLTGLWVEAYPSESRQIAENPLFEIGNHSFSHPAFAANCFGLPPIQNGGSENEVEKAQKIIIQTTGVVPILFRFPGGCYRQDDLQVISRLGLTIVHWNVVGGDGFNTNTQSIINNIERNVQNDSIIVLHLNDGTLAPKTYDAITQIVPHLKKLGYEFVKVSDLLTLEH